MIGKKISHYEIIEKLGEGGMGVVYKAEDTKLKRTVALKFLPPELTRDPEAKQRFIREAQAASALEHNNICNIHEIDETEDGQTYIVMACYEGEILKDKIQRGILKIEEAIDIAIQIAQGLEKAHKKGIVHRDIKPANVFITEDGVIKILDFGLAKLAGQAQLTKDSSTLGTVAYMSPEQLSGKDVDQRTDIWLLGVVMYEILTGELPFKGDYEQAVMYAILNEEPESVTTLKSQIPDQLEKIVAKSLKKNLSDRYQDMHGLRSDLEKLKKKMNHMAMKVADERGDESSSIAVLPFVNMSADPENEYFSDGLTEELINSLTKLKDLHVVARTSSFAFKGKDIDIREIGNRLNVQKVLEGSVRKAGNSIRITAQLINIEDGYHVWSDRYDRDLEDVFAIQDEISLAIVENLKIKLMGEEKEALIKRKTHDVEAYNLYLKGIYFARMLTIEGYKKAIEYLEQAIQRDSSYALAYYGLSVVYVSRSYWGNLPPKEAYPKACTYAKKALEIDESLAEVHAVLGFIYSHYDWNWKSAEQEFKQALQLNLNHAMTHFYYSIFLFFTGRNKEAIIEAMRARELDPLSSFINAFFGHALFYVGRYDESIEELRNTITLNPNFWYSHYCLGITYIGKSMYKEAILEIERAVKLSDVAPNVVTWLAVTCYGSGDKNRAKELFASLKARMKREYIPPTCFSYIYFIFGDLDQAYLWLEKAFEGHDSFVPWMRIIPKVRSRITDPRFKAVFKKMGLEE